METQASKQERATSPESSYPPGAVDFLLEALSFTADKVHGSTPTGWREVAEWLQDNEHDLSDLPRLLRGTKLPAEIRKSVEQLGGVKALDRKSVV